MNKDNESRTTGQTPSCQSRNFVRMGMGGAPRLLNIAKDFFGTDRMVFGSDAPMDSSAGRAFTHDAIVSILQMEISEAGKRKIFTSNAQKLLKLG